MLSVYTRHYPPCLHTYIRYSRCPCPKWIRGRLENAGLIRRSARTRSWAEAEEKARAMAQKSLAIELAVAAYLRDEQARKLKPGTLGQKKAFLKGDLLPWCNRLGLTRLDQLQLPQLREFRQTWDLSANTAGRRYERLRSFFAFCVANGWLDFNPTNTLKRPVRTRTVPTDYFTRPQFQRIVASTEEYEYGGGFDCWHRGRRMLALVFIDALEWSRHQRCGGTRA